MQFLYEVLPVFLFFIAFKLYDIYVATVVGIISTLLQVLIGRAVKGNWDKRQVVTFLIFVIFGGMTLYFHNPIFVKWKPTIVFWIFSVVIVGSQFTHKPITQRLMENVLKGEHTVPPTVWRNLNLIWAVFFVVLGSINLYVAYFFSNNAWVNFKFYGITSAFFVISVLQAIYLLRYMPDSKSNK